MVMGQERRQFVNTIRADLLETLPENPFTLPDPYNDNETLEQNVTNLYYQLRESLRTNRRISGLVAAFYLEQYLERRPLTPQERKSCRQLLTTHYVQCCVKIHNLFSIQGIEQIYRTKRTSYWMIRSVNKRDFTQLLNEAEDMLMM